MKEDDINGKYQDDSTQTNSALQDLFIETDSWLSALDFLAGEIKFYWKITKNYFRNIDTETTDRVAQLQKSLSKLELNTTSIRAEVLGFREQLAHQLKEGNAQNVRTAEESFASLQTQFHQLDKESREFKEDMFDVADDVYGE